jgi:tol-pal system protein YbgF
VKQGWLFFVILFLPACVSTDDFDRLRRDVQQLQQTSSDARKDVDSLKEKTAGVVKEDSFTAVRESQADLLSKVNETSRGLQELRGRFEENKYSTEKSLKDFTGERDLLRSQIAGLETQIKSLRDRLSAIENGAKSQELSEEPQRPADNATKAEPSPQDVKAVPAADSKSKSYDAAYQLFKDKKFRESREKFEAFMKSYPKTDLADNAQFWIAETYFAEKDFENAILSYETLVKKWPESDKASGGLYKQGLAFIEIGDAKTGKIILSKLIEKYPDSKDAELAKKKIAELDKKPPKKK